MNSIRFFSFAVVVAISTLVLVPRESFATIQEMDAIRYQGKETFITDFPLEVYLRRNAKRQLEFDVINTGNRKGYIACWEIREQTLYLVEFRAEIDGKPIRIEQVFPDTKLPVPATWYTGRLHVITGQALTHGFAQSAKYSALDVLTIKEGVVVRREVFRNARPDDIRQVDVDPKAAVGVPGFMSAFGAVGESERAVSARIECCETIRYENRGAILVEHPLDLRVQAHEESSAHPDLNSWPQLPGSPRNYSAAWEVRDSKLYLARFEATRDGKPLPISALFPNAKLPLQADWFTGRMHVITGLHYAQYTSADFLDIERGTVVRKFALHNFRTRDLLDGNIIATFSIVAVDPETGICGAAVASKYPGVGKVVPSVRAGVGAFCTQHYHRDEWRTEAIALLEKGKSPAAVLAELLANDDAPGERQLAIINAKGVTAVHNPTDAEESSRYWGAMSGRYYSCQGNTLAGREVITSMAKAYEETKGSLADRLMAALIAGDCAGGDHRGRLAAGIRVAKPEVDGVWFELDIDESDDAVRDLARKYAELKHDAKGEWRGAKLPFEFPSPPKKTPPAKETPK
jgi:uncharacterized Ntn-hydrolase superfamily protein